MTTINKILIIQYSPPHSASTVLTNILYGLIDELHDKPVNYFNQIDIKNKNKVFNLFNDENINIIKMHTSNSVSIDTIIKLYEKDLSLYFFCSERKDENLLIDSKYKNKDKYKNIFIFSYEELNEKENKIESVISLIYDTIQNNINIKISKETALERINKMDKCYEMIKHKPFTYVDTFYHIHGSHKNRNSKS